MFFHSLIAKTSWSRSKNKMIINIAKSFLNKEQQYEIFKVIENIVIINSKKEEQDPDKVLANITFIETKNEFQKKTNNVLIKNI